MRRWWFSGHRVRGGQIGKLLTRKSNAVRYVRGLQPQVNEIMGQINIEDARKYSTSNVTFSLNQVKEIKTKIEATASFYSEKSEAVFAEILKLHPKFKPKFFERSHHIFCFKFP